MPFFVLFVPTLYLIAEPKNIFEIILSSEFFDSDFFKLIHSGRTIKQAFSFSIKFAFPTKSATNLFFGLK